MVAAASPVQQAGTDSMFGRWIKRVGRWLHPNSRFSLGPAGERIAARYLQKLGYRIIARGHRQKFGEIDLIALDRGTLVFCEVKTWSQGDAAAPSEAVDARKQERLTRAALIYLKRLKMLEHPARFDVISIILAGSDSEPQIRHFKNAFEAVGRGQMFR